MKQSKVVKRMNTTREDLALIREQLDEIHSAIDTLHYYSDKKRHSDTDCPACGAADDGHNAIVLIEEAHRRVAAELGRLERERDEHAYYRRVQQTYGEEQNAEVVRLRDELERVHRILDYAGIGEGTVYARVGKMWGDLTELRNGLRELYKHQPITVARICDEVIDPSGKLLGELRKDS